MLEVAEEDAKWFLNSIAHAAVRFHDLEDASRAGCFPVHEGLLDVVAEELSEFRRRIGGCTLEPSCKPLVHAGAIRTGHALVRGKPDEGVRKSKTPCVATFDKALARERFKVALYERPCLLGKKRLQRLLLHVHSRDRRAAEHIPLPGTETIQAHREQAAKRDRHLVPVVVSGGGQQLLREQWVALRELDDPP